MLARLKAAYALIMCYWFVMYYTPSPPPPPIMFTSNHPMSLPISRSIPPSCAYLCVCIHLFFRSFVRLLSKWLFGLCSAVVFSTSWQKTPLVIQDFPHSIGHCLHWRLPHPPHEHVHKYTTKWSNFICHTLAQRTHNNTPYTCIV